MLSYWIVAGLYRILGISVAVERLGIALGVAGILLAAFLIGRAIRGPTAGLLAALCVATAPRVVMFGRRIFIDVYLTMFMSLALACLVLAERQPAHRRRYLLLMWAAIGLGVLTKGPVAIVLPAVACGIWLVVERRLSDVWRLMLLPGVAIVLVIVVPWYAALVVRHGWAPVTGFFIGENLDRFTTSMQPAARGPWFYLPVLFGDLFPWAPLLVVPLVSAWHRRATDADATPASLRRLLLIWILAIVGAFSLSQTKQDLYILPVIAAVAALVADALVTTGFGRDSRGLRALVGAVAVLSAVSGGLVAWLFGSGGFYAIPGALVLAGVLVAGGVGAVVLLVAGRGRQAVIGLAAAFIAFNYLFVARALPALEDLKPVVPLARTFAARAAPGAELGLFQLMLPSLVYYARQPVRVLDTLEEAQAFYENAPSGWAIMANTEYEALRGRVPGLCVAASRPEFGSPTLGDVMARRPPRDVLLVTNQCAAATR